MGHGLSLPIICAAKSCFCSPCFAHLKGLLNHPYLQDEEKTLWLWLATTCTDNSFTCSWNYEQISQALNKPPRVVHRALFRLMLMGFLQADLPIYYGEPTPEMVQAVRKLKLVLPPKPFFVNENANALVLPNRNRTNITLNLIKESKLPEKEQEAIPKNTPSLIPLSFIKRMCRITKIPSIFYSRNKD